MTLTREAIVMEAVRRVRAKHGITVTNVALPFDYWFEDKAREPVGMMTPKLIAAIRTEFSRIVADDDRHDSGCASMKTRRTLQKPVCTCSRESS